MRLIWTVTSPIRQVIDTNLRTLMNQPGYFFKFPIYHVLKHSFGFVNTTSMLNKIDAVAELLLNSVSTDEEQV